ncbi:unnamed protein product, partial [Ostreobium quekettii]
MPGEECSLRGPGDEGKRLPDGIQLILRNVSEMQSRIGGSRVSIFTLAADEKNDIFARQLACENGGVSSILGGSGEPLNSLGAYFQFLGFSMEARTEEVPAYTWAPLYTDASGLGRLTTFVYPVFVHPTCANGAPSADRLLLGVIG